jgi:hypothetical protein
MAWGEYRDDTGENIPLDEWAHDEDEPYPLVEPYDFEDWVDWYEPHLSNMWVNIEEYRKMVNLSKSMGFHADFWDFCKFVYATSDKYARPTV